MVSTRSTSKGRKGGGGAASHSKARTQGPAPEQERQQEEDQAQPAGKAGEGTGGVDPGAGGAGESGGGAGQRNPPRQLTPIKEGREGATSGKPDRSPRLPPQQRPRDSPGQRGNPSVQVVSPGPQHQPKRAKLHIFAGVSPGREAAVAAAQAGQAGQAPQAAQTAQRTMAAFAALAALSPEVLTALLAAAQAAQGGQPAQAAAQQALVQPAEPVQRPQAARALGNTFAGAAQEAPAWRGSGTPGLAPAPPLRPPGAPPDAGVYGGCWVAEQAGKVLPCDAITPEMVVPGKRAPFETEPPPGPGLCCGRGATAPVLVDHAAGLYRSRAEQSLALTAAHFSVLGLDVSGLQSAVLAVVDSQFNSLRNRAAGVGVTLAILAGQLANLLASTEPLNTALRWLDGEAKRLDRADGGATGVAIIRSCRNFYLTDSALHNTPYTAEQWKRAHGPMLGGLLRLQESSEKAAKHLAAPAAAEDLKRHLRAGRPQAASDGARGGSAAYNAAAAGGGGGGGRRAGAQPPRPAPSAAGGYAPAGQHSKDEVLSALNAALAREQREPESMDGMFRLARGLDPKICVNHAVLGRCTGCSYPHLSRSAVLAALLAAAKAAPSTSAPRMPDPLPLDPAEEQRLEAAWADLQRWGSEQAVDDTPSTSFAASVAAEARSPAAFRPGLPRAARELYPNLFMEIPPLKYEAVTDMPGYLQQGDFMFTTDDKSGYWNFQLDPEMYRLAAGAGGEGGVVSAGDTREGEPSWVENASPPRPGPFTLDAWRAAPWTGRRSEEAQLLLLAEFTGRLEDAIGEAVKGRYWKQRGAVTLVEVSTRPYGGRRWSPWVQVAVATRYEAPAAVAAKGRPSGESWAEAVQGRAPLGPDSPWSPLEGWQATPLEQAVVAELWAFMQTVELSGPNSSWVPGLQGGV
ncbi:hypothetical protein HYH03_000788 [Edaphochlamys debaryana]|uniref:Uncharacterized protein n=1 Tax=Edaphochlamys debaryana TaxID=47281 RepID=A0A836C583_9CHLO|nr:hypothetical protein HYH03_000788 [Edaphochlamys debaryana]|eukprot:KAG2500966.1 hypothetical protein HYH03_000788 [Edaphochlamys debaryana]